VSWERVDLSSPEFEGPSEPPVVCGLLYQGKRHAASGPPEAAKTLAALIFGLEWMRAGLGRVALLDFESGGRAIRLLLDELGASVEEVASVYFVAPAAAPDAGDIEAMASAGVTFAVVDSAAGAYDASDLDDNKRADAERFYRGWIAPLFVRGVTTLVLDHVVKNSDARGRYAIGSERKLGTVDVHLGFEPVKQLRRGGNGLVRITTHKDRPGHLPRPRAAELELHSAPDSHGISWAFKAAEADDAEGGDFRPTYLMEKVSTFLEALDSGGATRRQVEEAVRGKAEYVRLAMDVLLGEGYAAEIPGGRGRPLASVKPFREDELIPTRPELVPAANPPKPELVPNSSCKDRTQTPQNKPKAELVPTRPKSSRDEKAYSSPRPSPSRGDGDELNYDQDELDRLERLGDHYGLT
jgi:AAA domain